MSEFAKGGPIPEGSIFELEPGCPGYLIPKSAAERHDLGVLERMNEMANAPHRTYRWCWVCQRMNDEDTQADRDARGCGSWCTTKED